jgi:hypothetical protein
MVSAGFLITHCLPFSSGSDLRMNNVGPAGVNSKPVSCTWNSTVWPSAFLTARVMVLFTCSMGSCSVRCLIAI